MRVVTQGNAGGSAKQAKGFDLVLESRVLGPSFGRQDALASPTR